MKHDESLLDYAYREMRMRIQNGTYSPASKLSTQEISDTLGISRTPVVSALNRLVAEGLAVALPRRGVVVADFTPQQLREITEVRQMFELYAVKHAIKNVDYCPWVLDEMQEIADELLEISSDEMTLSDFNKATELEIRFHTLFVQLSGNSQLTKLYVNNWNIGSMFQVFMLSKVPLSKHKFSFQEHIEIIELLREKDEKALNELIPKHLGSVFNTIEWIMRNGARDMQGLFRNFHLAE